MPTIMIIDDDQALRQALSLRLSAAGFEVMAAEHPQAATRAVLRDRPDLVLLDIEMPRYNGLDFHECLRVTERGCDIPIIYLSGAATAPNREDAYRQGARAFIAKPYQPDDLLATIRGVLDAEMREPAGGSRTTARA